MKAMLTENSSQHITPPFPAVDNLVDLFAWISQNYPNHSLCSGSVGSLTYTQVDSMAAKFAAWLQNDAGLTPGTRVAVQLPNLPQYLPVFFGILRAGGIVVNVNPLYTAPELQYQLNDSGAEVIVVFAATAAPLLEIIDQTSIRFTVVAEAGDLLPQPLAWFANRQLRRRLGASPKVPAAIPLRRLLGRFQSSRWQRHHCTPQDCAVLQYTGGTTGVSKGAMLSHANLLANINQVEQALAGFHLEPGKEAIVMPLPLFHIYALMLALVMMVMGQKIFLITNPSNMLETVNVFKRNKITLLGGTNTLFAALTRHSGFRQLQDWPFKLVMSGGMALTSTVSDEWHELTGNKICQGYGLTEASPVVCLNRASHMRMDSVGQPLEHTEVRITDTNSGVELPFGEVGELEVKGPQTMMGYWQRDAETKKVLADDGWLKTGDLAILEEDGHIRIVDRSKDMLVVGGYNVYPNELEDVIGQHPSIKECAVVGQPDSIRGDIVCLFAVCEENNLTRSELISWCRERLAPYKVPKQVTFIDSLPKSAVGKVLRWELREQLESS